VSRDVQLLGKALIAVAVLLMLVSFGQQTIFHLGLISKPIWLLDADVEKSLPTWYSVALLFLTSVALVLVACQEFLGESGHWWYWAALSAGFAVMSVDEHLELHERLFSPQTAHSMHLSDPAARWLEWFPVPVMVIAALAFGRFVFSLPPRTRNALILAAVLYGSGIIGVELVMTAILGHLDHKTMGGVMMVTVEESFELSGILVMLMATASYYLELVGRRAASPNALAAHAREPLQVKTIARANS
jgi:hypothetical protein